MTIKTLAVGLSAFALGAAFGSVLAFAQQNVPGYSFPTPPVYVVTLFEGPIDLKTDYPSLNPATFQPFGGRYIVHGGKVVTFEGVPPGQYVVIRFDSMQKVQAWRASAAFKELSDIHKIGNLRVFAVEGTTQ